MARLPGADSLVTLHGATDNVGNPGDEQRVELMVRRIAFAIGAALVAMSSATSAAARDGDGTLCVSRSDIDPDWQISECTTVIQSGGKTREDLAAAFNNRGFAYAAKSQYDRAIHDFDRAIRLRPDFAEAFYNRGTVCAAKRQYDRAIRDYDQATRLKPDYAEAFNKRGYAYAAKSQYDRAIQDYDQAIRLKPDYADPFNNRGNAYAAKGQYDRALEDYDQFERLIPM